MLKGMTTAGDRFECGLSLFGTRNSHDPVDLLHHPDRTFEPQRNRFRRFWIDQAEFGLQMIESLPGFIGAIDDLVPIHPFGFIVENIFPAGSQ